jgi:hypothetical protein
MCCNLLKPTGYLMEQTASHSKIVNSAHTVGFFGTYLKVNIYVGPTQHKPIGFSQNQGNKCLLHDKKWVFL